MKKINIGKIILLGIIIGILNPSKIVAKELSWKQKETILKIVKSEQRVRDAIFPNGSNNLLYVGMYDDGGRQDGFAEYLCISIKDEVKLPHQIYIKIVDYKDVLQQKGFREIGRCFCRP